MVCLQHQHRPGEPGRTQNLLRRRRSPDSMTCRRLTTFLCHDVRGTGPHRDPEPLDTTLSEPHLPVSRSLTNTYSSKLGRDQWGGAELVVGRNRSSAEKTVGGGGLKWRRSRGGGRRRAGADGRLKDRRSGETRLDLELCQDRLAKT